MHNQAIITYYLCFLNIYNTLYDCFMHFFSIYALT
jgi:hypothetical protein